jgi:hypothetical protein
MSQKIRPSQFVTTYGPGSIIELPNGPAIIPSARIGLFKDRNPEDYEIFHRAMSQVILQDLDDLSVPRRIFSLPTNESEGVDVNATLYRTKPFPKWNLCLNHAVHLDVCGRDVDILYTSPRDKTPVRCPVCESQRDHNHLPTASAVRFVSICKEGHLDEVEWDFLLHKDQPNHACTGTVRAIPQLQGTSAFYWEERGGALSDIQIECPRCNVRKSFGEFFYSDHLKCSGRQPETEPINSVAIQPWNCPNDGSTSERSAKIVQRQATSIRMPEIKTLLSIHPRASPLHEILSDTAISSTLTSVRRRSGGTSGKIDSEDKIAELLKELGWLVEDDKLESKKLEKLQLTAWKTLVRIIEDITQDLPVGYHGLVLEEFDELYRASNHGAPPLPPPPEPQIQDSLFVVHKRHIKPVTTKLGHKFLVVPIATLQTVSVQTGYRRDDTDDGMQVQNQSALVPSSFSLEGESDARWYPGVKYTGEGIFIRLDDTEDLEKILEGNPVADKWMTNHRNEKQEPTIPKFLFRDSKNSKDEIHPGFVWWHTLAHLLIRIISEECGYSSASIRERIYFKIDENDKIRGGILLYAAQPGSEGTLGGLTSLVGHFDSFIQTALEKVSTCSADPLCSDSNVDNQKINGACCYGCLMNSETSCEHRNMWLDRNVLANSLP